MLLDNILKTKKFVKESGDYNKIHINKKFSQNFFFKKPVLHGINVALAALSKFMKNKKKNCRIKKIEINFKDYCLEEDILKFKILKNKITVYDDFAEKINIIIDYKNNNSLIKKNKDRISKLYKINNLTNPEILIRLFNTSKIIAIDHIGHGCMIYNINIKCSDNNKNHTIKKTKLINNLFKIKDKYENYTIETLCGKLKKYKINKFSKPLLNNKKLKKQKILIFGHGDISKNLIEYLGKKNFDFNFISFKIDKYNPIFSKNIKNKIYNTLKRIKPNYIFYFSSPRIFRGNSKLLNKLYKIFYVDILIFILRIINQDLNNIAKVFYPSTIFLDNNDDKKRYLSYTLNKYKAENICKLKKFKKIAKFYRLPKLKTGSNYNFLGFYEGENITSIKKFIFDFLKN